jgi:sulfate permease, SulP family
VWFITFALTVMADLTVAVEVGMALAALLYIYRVAQTTTVGVLTAEDVEDARPHQLQDQQVPPYVTILRIHGLGRVGATEKLREETADLNKYAPIVILRLRHMTAIDATGLHGLEVLSDRLKKSGRTLLLCGARHQPAKMLQRADFIAHIGEHNILPHAQAALERAREVQAGFAGLGEEVVHDLNKAPL